MDAPMIPILGDGVSHSVVKAIGLGLVTGVGFGILIEKSNLSETWVVRAQCKLRRHTMLKTFLSAASTSSLIFGALKWFYPEVDIAPRPQILVASSLGGALIGVGGFICGSCPPTLLSQLGTGIEDATYAFPGAICGAAAYSYLQPAISSLLPTPRVFPSIPEYLGIPFWYLSIPYTLSIYGQLYLLEQWAPYVTAFDEEDEGALDEIKYSDLRLSQLTWPPRKAGVGLGLLQAPAVLFMNTPLGTSAAFVTLAAHTVSLFDPNIWSREYFTRFMFGEKNYWQVALDIGIIAGAYISARSSRKRELVLQKRSRMSHAAKSWAFFGGFLMMFGARLADGCTSGHGMSGVAQFGVGSFVSVASIITGGYLASVLATRVPGTGTLRFTKQQVQDGTSAYKVQ